MAWNTPLLMVSRGVLKLPLDSAGTLNPCVTTVIRITPILINANVLAFASYSSQSVSSTLAARELAYLSNISIQT
jgi:hypothetical protein